jgi:acyl-CoA thioesterase FadM
VETKFHKPIAVGTKLIVKAWVVKQRRRLFDAHAEIRIDGPENMLLAEADATMCLINQTPKDEASRVAGENRANVSA